MKTALVIGATGFIGGHLVEGLLAQGKGVRALVRQRSIATANLPQEIEIVPGDILDGEAVAAACEGVDQAFVLVTVKSHGLSSEEYGNAILSVHEEGLKNLVNGCRLSGVRRLLYFSSTSAMGCEPQTTHYDEGFEAPPADDYGKAKKRGEEIVQSAEGIEWVILRPPAVFGERGLGPLAKVAALVAKGIVPVVGNGKNRQSMVYVKTVVDQALHLAEHSEAMGSVYLQTEREDISVNDLIGKVSASMGKKPFILHVPTALALWALPIVNFFARIILRRELMVKEQLIAITSERTFSSDRIVATGYNFRFSLDEGIERTMQWHLNEQS